MQLRGRAYNRRVPLRWSFAVRVVLSLCLVVNGVGAGGIAHAGHTRIADPGLVSSAGHLAAASAPARATSDVAAHNSGQPCHAAQGARAQDTAPADPAIRADDPLPRCCHLAGCGGTCLQHPAGAIVSLSSRALVVRTTETVSLRTLHAAPELPHLTRPPIA
jgi:hypothetical protein